MPRMRCDSVSDVSSSPPWSLHALMIWPGVGFGDHEVYRRAGDLHSACSAWPCGSRPGNDGSSDGWMFSILPYQRCTNSAVNSAVIGGRSVRPCVRPARAATPLRSRRDLGRLRCRSQRPSAARPHRPGWKLPQRSRPENLQPSRVDQRGHVEPRPEIRMATRRFIARDRGRCRPHDARPPPGSPRRAMDGLGRFRSTPLSPDRWHQLSRLRYHADAAVEDAVHLGLGDAAVPLQPVEHLQASRAGRCAAAQMCRAARAECCR